MHVAQSFNPQIRIVFQPLKAQAEHIVGFVGLGSVDQLNQQAEAPLP